MPQISRESFVAESKALFICALCITLANLYFQKSVIDLMAGKSVEGDMLAFLMTQSFLAFITYVAYRSYKRSKMLLTSSSSRKMTVTEEKNTHNGSPTHTDSNDCGE